MERNRIIFFQNLVFFLFLEKNSTMRVIGRQAEKAKLEEIRKRKEASFVAIYGRRRVGKTFLVKEFFNHQFTFYTTGLAKGNTKTQLVNFGIAINNAFLTNHPTPKDWLSAFALLQTELSNKEGERLIFLDELPWMDTKKSGFLMGLEYFWNSWASAQRNLILIVCGSAASWMINQLIRNTEGLYGRVTHRMKIEPFTLSEVEEYLQSRNILLDRYQIVQLYMVMGGIPYYLEQVRKGLSASQNIEAICFEDSGLLRSEFRFIFSSLFSQAEKHERLLRTVYELGARATRERLIQQSGLASSGDLSNKLAELEESGFLKSYIPFGKARNKKIYFVSDYYTLFYLRFIEQSGSYEPGKWLSRIDDPAVQVWAGLAFEQVCWDHLTNIKKGLKILGVYTETSPWQLKGESEVEGAQVDLVIDRKDRVINLLEIKFSVHPFEITKAYDLKLRNKVAAFKQATATTKSVFLVMLTTFGLLDNPYARSVVQSELTLEDLFQ
ncbi:MAG TPA: ATP-binding protein [Saprospiraceae bacterium]|nr:ATP-binding protein [Saprospiraceae bacterium]HMQ82184.1 ATP-binding protein [Saprospiraceae bacterium]